MREHLERLSTDPAAGLVAPALTALLAQVGARAPSVADLDLVLAPRAGVRFEPQPPRARRKGTIDLASSYDGSIHVRGVVPSREGSLHDVLNALVWASLPRSKRALHARQHAAQRAHVPEGATRLPNARPREADVLAMLDEGGLLLGAAEARLPALEAALRTGDVTVLATAIEASGASVSVCGHAVLEHLAEGRPGDPRAATYPVPDDGGLDAGLAGRLATSTAFVTPTPWPAVPVQALLAALPRSTRIGLPASGPSVR